MRLTTTPIANSSVTLAVALLAAGCGGGGSGVGSPPLVAQAPRIEGQASLVLDQDTSSAPQKIRLLDADSDSAQLELTAASSDQALLPDSRIRIAGTGQERTLIVIPADDALGAATVLLTVRDPSGLTGFGAFEVRVNPVLASFRQLANESFNTPDSGVIGKVAGVTVQPDVDDDAQAFDGLLANGAQ